MNTAAMKIDAMHVSSLPSLLLYYYVASYVGTKLGLALRISSGMFRAHAPMSST